MPEYSAAAAEILFDGFLRLYTGTGDEDDNDSPEVILPEIKPGDRMLAKSISAQCKFTAPPQRYTQGTLTRKLEELGIGRPSTWGTIVPTLSSGRGYITEGDKEGRKMEVENLTLTGSTIKASRPMFVLIFSILLFGERLNLLQWLGVAVVMTALLLSSRAKHHETDKKTSAKGISLMILSVLAGSASALYDKHILQQLNLDPMFVQSWTNVYVTILLAILLLVQYLTDKKRFQPFVWDWRILLISVLITVADALYFFAVKEPDAMLSIISMVRRCSVLITFLGGALILKEGHVKEKALEMLMMMAGVALLLYGSL